MISERKIAANRRNSQKSSGPRTAAGKAIASHNALRHGLAALPHSRPELSPEIARLAKAICGDDNDLLLLEQASVIAANEQVLRSIRAQRLIVIERLRDTKPVALAKGDNSLALGKALYLQMKTPRYEEEYYALVERLKGPRTKLEPGVEWVIDLDAASKLYKERDEYEAMEAAAPDLIRLERYYRRTWSRQKRAIRTFAKMKSTRAVADTAHPPPGLQDETTLASTIATK
jgi:hypothetical protein